MEAVGGRRARGWRRSVARLNWFAAPAIVSAGYWLFAFVSSLRRSNYSPSSFPPVSILKPIRGRDDAFAEAIASHATQDYSEFEILFGISDPQDPARRDIENLIHAFPNIPIRLIVCDCGAPNGKVGVLETLAAQARHPVLVVSDSDIRVEPGYLRSVVAALMGEGVGLATCLYRAAGRSFAARSEALGIATEFVPSVLVARQIGVNEFAMGSTLAFRAADLARFGGFHAIRDYLADDYQLGKHISEIGLRVVLAEPVVETGLGAGTWGDVWKHQVRWSRTVRVSRTAGYFGYAVTHATVFALLAGLTGSPAVGALVLIVRMLAGLHITALVLRDRRSLTLWWWMPARDLFGFAVWLAGCFGNSVEWRGSKLTIDPRGRISSAVTGK